MTLQSFWWNIISMGGLHVKITRKTNIGTVLLQVNFAKKRLICKIKVGFTAEMCVFVENYIFFPFSMQKITISEPWMEAEDIMF
jgi:hypothetical protein